MKLNETVKQLVPLKTIEASTEQLHKPEDHIVLKVAEDRVPMMVRCVMTEKRGGLERGTRQEINTNISARRSPTHSV